LISFTPDNIQNKIALEIYNGKTPPLAAYKKVIDYFYNNGMYEEYYNEFSAQIEHRPYNINLYYEGIKNLQEKGFNDLALKLVYKLHDFSPTNYTYSVLGLKAFENQKLDIAIENLSKAVKIDANDINSLIYLAGSELITGKKLNTIKLSDVSKHYSKIKATAENYLRKRRLYEAAIFMNLLHKIKPDFYSTKWIGIIQVENKNYSVAINYLEKSLKYSDKDAIVFYNLAVSYWSEGKKSEAESAINKCLNISPDFKTAIDWKVQHSIP
jgi:tetratricopeptide (TPR) repeat protein